MDFGELEPFESSAPLPTPDPTESEIEEAASQWAFDPDPKDKHGAWAYDIKHKEFLRSQRRSLDALARSHKRRASRAPVHSAGSSRPREIRSSRRTNASRGRTTSRGPTRPRPAELLAAGRRA